MTFLVFWVEFRSQAEYTHDKSPAHCRADIKRQSFIFTLSSINSCQFVYLPNVCPWTMSNWPGYIFKSCVFIPFFFLSLSSWYPMYFMLSPFSMFCFIHSHTLKDCEESVPAEEPRKSMDHSMCDRACDLLCMCMWIVCLVMSFSACCSFIYLFFYHL